MFDRLLNIWLKYSWCHAFDWFFRIVSTRENILKINHIIYLRNTVLDFLLEKPSPSIKSCSITFSKNPFKMMSNVFYFILKTLFILKIFKFLPWPWLKRLNQFQNLWRHNLASKKLQYTHCPILSKQRLSDIWSFNRI